MKRQRHREITTDEADVSALGFVFISNGVFKAPLLALLTLATETTFEARGVVIVFNGGYRDGKQDQYRGEMGRWRGCLCFVCFSV